MIKYTPSFSESEYFAFISSDVGFIRLYGFSIFRMMYPNSAKKYMEVNNG